MSGALMGMRRGMDRFGLCLVGTVTALGGGTVRDVLLGHYPLAWISHPDYVLITIGAASVAAASAKWLRNWQRLFVTVDAIGLIAFTVIGCDVAATLDVSPAIVVLAGAITGVCGGMLRDVLCNQMPLVLREELYASIALGAGVAVCGTTSLRRGAGAGLDRGAGRRFRGAHAGRAVPLATQGIHRRRFGRRKLIPLHATRVWLSLEEHARQSRATGHRPRRFLALRTAVRYPHS